MTALLALGMAACGGPGPPQPQSSSAGERARRIVSAWVADSTVPGIQYVVVDATGVVFDLVSGSADLAVGRPMDAGTTLMAYSMSKTITAVAVLQLVESGRLSLDDRLARFVDQSPYDPSITVRQLLSHTAGLPNPLPLRWVHPAGDTRPFDEAAALDAVMSTHARPSGAPGAKFAYSNIGYWLLGRLVSKASGQPFVDYVQQHVIAPLGVPPGELAYAVVDPARHAAGYLERFSLLNMARPFLIDRTMVGQTVGRWVEIRPHYVDGPSYGGLIGTARAFGAFLQDQLKPASVLIGGPARRLLDEPQVLRDGTPIPMTLGWHVGRAGSRPILFKEGGGGGFHALMRLYTGTGLASIVMTNATGFDVRAALDRLDAGFLDAREDAQGRARGSLAGRPTP